MSDELKTKVSSKNRIPVLNYARFYVLLKKMEDPVGDKEQLRRSLVCQYTQGRTDSLREMLPEEYRQMCHNLEEITGERALLRKMRSECLKQMQRLGVDTTDWTRVNALCQDPRIAGKEFRCLKAEELKAVSVKLRVIRGKGGMKRRKEAGQVQTQQAEAAGRAVLPMSVTAEC